MVVFHLRSAWQAHLLTCESILAYSMCSFGVDARAKVASQAEPVHLAMQRIELGTLRSQWHLLGHRAAQRAEAAPPVLRRGHDRKCVMKKDDALHQGPSTCRF